jgi:DNA-binding NtrC family response regulator
MELYGFDGLERIPVDSAGAGDIVVFSGIDNLQISDTNVVKRLLLLSQSEEIDLGEVESQLAADAPATEPLIKQDLLAMPLREAREHFERAYLQQQLLLCGGKVGQLAKRVGMERTHLYRKLRALGVDFRQAATDD